MLHINAHAETIRRGVSFRKMLNAMRDAANTKNNVTILLDFFILFAYTKECKVLGAFPPRSLALTASVCACWAYGERFFFCLPHLQLLL